MKVTLNKDHIHLVEAKTEAKVTLIQDPTALVQIVPTMTMEAEDLLQVVTVAETQDPHPAVIVVVAVAEEDNPQHLMLNKQIIT